MTPEELLNLSDDAIAIFGPDAEIAATSAGFQALFPGMTAFLATGTPWPLFLAEATRRGFLSDDASRRLAFLEDSLNDANAPSTELVAETADRTHRLSLIATSDGGFALKAKLDPVSGASDDRDLEQIMAKVLEACPVCLTMARIGDGHILYRSPEATALLGKGFNSRDHFQRREERADFITELLASNRVDDMPFSARRADGSAFEASISARLIEYRSEDVIVASIEDLTEDLAMRRELDHQRQQIFQSEKMSALGELLAGVAHELNNPLSIIAGNAQLLAEDGISGASKARVDKVSTAAERCVAIVRAFLSMAREKPLQKERINVGELLVTAREAFEAMVDTPLVLTIDAPDDLPEVLVDEVQIVQVLTNLMTNAHQAVGDAPDARITLSTDLAAGGDAVHIRVSDNGPGVPEEIASRIFDPLFTTKSAGKGTGIGLALCHRIVTAHGGGIILDQTHDGGALFVMTIPTVA